MNEEQVLKIKILEENSFRVESKASDIKESIYKDIYKDAFRSLNEILIQGNHPEFNNLIVFTGERGSGKTSCMMSFNKLINCLKDEKQLDEMKSQFSVIKDNELNFKNHSYVHLEMIDPSMFEKNNNILEIIISKLFYEFKTKIEKDDYNNSDDYDDDKKRKLIKQFEKVHKSLRTLNKTKKEIFDGDMLSSLIMISDSTNIKKDIEILIDWYMKFMEPNESKQRLIISIDDIDLNTKYAYEMVEQIRKYLMSKNIVILMALKIEQLLDIVKKRILRNSRN